MASSTDLRHRALPALAMLLALVLLAAIVWWRVLERGSGSDHRTTASPCPTAAPSTQPTTTTLPRPSAVDVTVLNATDRTGLAASVRSRLHTFGFASSHPAGNWTASKVAGVAQVRYVAADRAAATLVGYYLPGSTLVVTRGVAGAGRAAVTVVLGDRYRTVASPAAVARSAGAHAGGSVAPSGRTSPSAGPSPNPSPSPTCG